MIEEEVEVEEEAENITGVDVIRVHHRAQEEVIREVDVTAQNHHVQEVVPEEDITVQDRVVVTKGIDIGHQADHPDIDHLDLTADIQEADQDTEDQLAIVEEDPLIVDLTAVIVQKVVKSLTKNQFQGKGHQVVNIRGVLIGSVHILPHRLRLLLQAKVQAVPQLVHLKSNYQQQKHIENLHQ